MDTGGTKMEPPRPFLQESPAQPAANTCGNLSLDSARPVALETTPNPLIYWPPPASTLPLRETADAPRNQTSNADPSQPNYSTERDSGSVNFDETKCHPSYESGVTNQPGNLHHNLPPIAGITSSHNYRGVREAQKNQQPGAVEEAKTEKTTPVETGASGDTEKKTESKQDDGADCEIVEVLTKPSTERPKTTNSYYVFSIPAAVNTSKAVVSSRAPTPFVSCPSPATDPLVLNTNCPNLPSGSPSPSQRTVPSPSSRPPSSPHFAALSPTLQSRSPSQSPRILPSNLPSPKLHRALTSNQMKLPSPVDGSQMLNSPHPMNHPQNNSPSPFNRTDPSPSTRPPSSPFAALSPTLQSCSPSQSPRIPPSNLPSPKLHRPLSATQMKLPSPVDSSQMLNSPHPMGHPQNNPPSPSQRTHSHSYLNTPRPNYTNSPVHNFHPDPNLHPSQDSIPKQPPQRINQSADNQVCRNPFELPITKPYAYQSDHQMVHHGTNIPHPKMDQFMNVPGDHHMTPVFYPGGFKPQTAKDSDVKYKQMNSLSKGMYPPVGDQNFPHQELPKHPEPIGSKVNGPSVTPWGKPEPSDVNYANKNFKVNGNEFSNRKMPEVGYQTPGVKHPPEGFAGSLNEKQNGSLNPLSQRFPPVPQSNYDLNRHIYDSMTGGRSAQPQVARPNNNPQMCKNEPFYRDISSHQEQDKTKNYMHSVPGKFNNLPDKSAQDAYQKRPMSVQPLVNPAFPQTNDSRHPDHRRPTNQGFAPRMNTSHVSQPPCPTLPPPDRNRPTFPQKHTEYDVKKLPDGKPGGGLQFPSPQPMIPPAQGKVRTPSSTAVPVRSKRESPLDLSVKTVRQSADSTKDDGEVYLQNFRNFIQGSGQPRYPVSQSSEGATGAPKIDFTPNFAGFHTEPPAASSHHKPEMSALPPLVESFKKYPARLPTPAVQHSKNKPAFDPGKYFSPPAAEPTIRYPEHFRGETLKRSMDNPLRTQPKMPKIPKIDPWKLAFDQQIEQRLNSARISHQNSQNAERAMNGTDPSKPPLGPQHSSTYQRHSGNHYRGANMYPRPPVQTSATPYNPSYLHQPQCQPATPQTPQEKLQHRENVGHSPDPEQIIKQISKGVMPDHKLLQDKNVLSILRSSLEEKEAKLMQLREVAKRKEKYKELTSSDSMTKPFQPYDQAPKNQPQPKQTLPPFGALTLERMCAPPSFPGHRLNLPRPVDTVKIDIELTRKYFIPVVKNEEEKSGIPGADVSPHDDAQGPPTDLDGLAAFLAARIRTKGELKQVGPTSDPARPGFPHQLKTHPGHGPSIGEPYDRNVPASATTFQPNGSPPKLVRESRLLLPLRRRYFSHTEEETPTTSGTQNEEQRPLPPRDPNGIRSSSETSVFDFRESDSEGEMPVLERQTLEGMRRDRRTIGSKHYVPTTATTTTTMTTEDDVIEAEKPEVIAELDKSHPDPFWNTAFDMFVEQLEKKPPKRSVRRKKVVCRAPYNSEMEAEDSDKCRRLENESEEEKKNDIGLIQVKKEPEEQQDKIENVPDGHVKLSSSRLKIYQDEMRLKEEKMTIEKDEISKMEEREQEVETEKSKVRQTKKEDEAGVKTRGKSKVEEKESTFLLDFDLDSDERDTRSDSDSSAEDDDDSLSLSGLESESTDSETTRQSSNSNYSSSDDSENEAVAKKKQRMQTRLQTRSTRQRQVRGTGMKLRSKVTPLPKATAKPVKKKKKRKDFYTSGKKKTPCFGDGSNFRPGWEEECYKFKQQLRMPEKLISISRPPKRSSVSLPDLDPYRNSSSLDSSDVSIAKKSETGKAGHGTDDSDVESTKQKSRTPEGSPPSSDNNVTSLSLLKSRNGKKAQSSSIINMLVDKYGKGNLKKQKELKAMNERKSPRVLPKATDKPELLPTPGSGIGKENVLKDKEKKRTKDVGKKKSEENDPKYLGYFRRKTDQDNFKDSFKRKVGLLPQEFSPVVLKSRTRTQTKDSNKRATLMEVFGEERPASAPPLTRDEDSTDQEKAEKCSDKKKPKVVKKACGGVVTRGRGKLTRSGRPGLRSTAVLRSNKAVQNSKRHLNAGRKRNINLLRIRAMASKKFSSNQLPITKKRLKLKSVRRKFRSGFDYIRKKKKLKKDGDSADGSVKEKRLTTRPMSESVEDIQNEIKNWVINKGLGETLLHRAARLGYTDVAAYCLEKMDCSPSPRDNAGYTPLHEACSRGHLEIAKLLLMYGASVSESAKGGIRPLHEAAENGFTELIRLLLSYGADPLLETYTGHTALSLVTDEEARRLIQHHLADVQGNVAPVWTFQGPASFFDPLESGHDPLCDPPSTPSVHSEYELETSESMLPTLYCLTGDPDRRWVLMKDVLTYTKAKSKEAVLKQLGAASYREMKLSEFNEQSRSCNLLGIGDRAPTKASKVVLLLYDDKLRQLLGVENVVV